MIASNLIRAAFSPARTYRDVCGSSSNPWPVFALFTLVYAVLRIALSSDSAFSQTDDWMYTLGSSVGFLVRALLLVYFIFLAGDRFQRMKITMQESSRIVAYSLFPAAMQPLLTGWLPWGYVWAGDVAVFIWSVWVLAIGLRVCKKLPLGVGLLLVLAAQILIKALSSAFVGIELG